LNISPNKSASTSVSSKTGIGLGSSKAGRHLGFDLKNSLAAIDQWELKLFFKSKPRCRPALLDPNPIPVLLETEVEADLFGEIFNK
jgi:hypothetical protein